MSYPEKYESKPTPENDDTKALAQIHEHETINAPEESKKIEQPLPAGRTLESLRKEMAEADKDKAIDMADLVKLTRLHQTHDSLPVNLPAEKKYLVASVANSSVNELTNDYEPGFGVFPSSDSKENFYQQVWTRDFAHAAGNYFASQNPPALIDSLNTIFKHQRSDGALPFRVEKEYLILKVFPGLRSLARPAFNFFEKTIKGRDERPVYEGQDFVKAQDTVPAAIIALGEFFINSPEGREFVKQHFGQMKKAVDFFRAKADPSDGLIVARRGLADWADSINRQGKLGTVNVWWARSLRLMEFMANALGYEEDAKQYKNDFAKIKASVMEKLYNGKQGYFRADEGEERVDTVASIFGSLYLLGSTEAVKVQETLKSRMTTPSGLKNFDPPYPNRQIMLTHRLIGHQDYHNADIWPWVTCQNIQVKIKIALQHPEAAIREQYKKEAVEDLVKMADLFREAGGAYEIFQPNEPKPAIKKRLFITTYQPPKNNMGNLAAYQGAYLQLKDLGWI